MSKKMRRARRRIGRKNPISIISNVSKSLKDNNMLMINIEFNDVIQIGAGNLQPVLLNGLGYQNITSLLSSATTYTEMASRFSMFKITGIRIECRPVFMPNSTQNWEYPVFCIAFYPSVTNTNLNSTIIGGYDKTLVCSTANPQTVSRTYKFFNNYFPGTGGGGYGVWNSTNSISTLPGTIQVGGYTLRTSMSGAAVIAQARIVFSVIFKDKSLTA